MLVRKRLDISWADLLRAWFSACCTDGPSARSAKESIETAFGSETFAWPCLSVRTGFDATLAALALPPGSEVLTSALTIPGMLRIVEEHGLVPVPVEVDPLAAATSLAYVERSLTSRTRAFLSASLFGARQNLAPLADWSRERGLVFLADEAQAFAGPAGYATSPADVTLLSFGPIKTCTALAGGVLLFRDQKLRDAAGESTARYSTQSSLGFAARAARFAAIKALGYAPVADLAAASLRAVGRDPDAFAAQAAQSFPGDDFFRKIRRRPAPALMKTLARRLATFDARRIADRAAAGKRLRERIGPDFVVVGAEDPRMTYWTFPILVDDPWATAAALRRRGFDATARSSLTLVNPPTGGDPSASDRTRAWFGRLIFLPFDVSYSRKRLDRLAEEFRRVARPFRPDLPEEAPSPGPRQTSMFASAAS
ncbi:MAG TPA: DegT/DnrJ/EryC1/StrS family aminotransferase [Pirellulaceae bacterium]|jgi:dTDP-4-amino-4,6-dideoxygalactose transaminase|nr:DegT/DnrJ/EryC1/StrS family aminotransferase [Pirellulaceae bacterium]